MSKRKTDRRLTVWVQDIGRPNLVLRWLDQDGAQCQQTAGTSNHRKALKLATRLEHELAEQNATRDITWDEFCTIYLSDHLSQLDDDTQRHWHSVASKVESFGAPKWLDDINERWLTKLLSWMLKDGGLSSSASESYLKRLRAGLNWAQSQKLIDEAPRVPMPKRRRKSSRGRGRSVTQEEFERWMLACEMLFPLRTAHTVQRLMRGVLYSGLRLDEAADLWWTRSDKIHIVNLDHDVLEPMIVFPWQAHKAKTDDLLPCSPDMASMLREFDPELRTGRVFPVYGIRDKPVTSPDYIGGLIAHAGQKAGIIVHTYDSGKTKYATTQDLRRTFATRWAAAGLSVIDLQTIMRHESIETTQQYYLDVDRERLAAKMRGSTT